MKLRLTLSLLAILALGGASAWYIIESSHAHGAGEHTEHSGHADEGKEEHHGEAAVAEMQTTIPAATAKREGILAEAAGPALLQQTVSVYGSVKLNSNRIARAVPRFGGMVLKAEKSLGDPVASGETVALVETNQALSTIEVKAPLSGVIVDRDVTAGETVADGTALYTIADLSEVWVDLNVPKRDQARIRVGQKALIHADDGGQDAAGTLSWISPISSPEAQTLIARVVLSNPEQRWRPGLYVRAEISVAEDTVPVAVREGALQNLSEVAVVFVQNGERYQARPLTLGRRGAGWVEVLKGLQPGELYVVENSFLIKADIGKAGAAHED